MKILRKGALAMVQSAGIVNILNISFGIISLLVTSLSTESQGAPLISARRLFRRNLATSREQVRKLQLQAMLESLEPESDLDALAKAVAKDRSIAMKRSADDTMVSDYGEAKDMDDKSDKLPWGIINRNVPLGAADNSNQMQKRGTPCARRKRDLDSQGLDRRSLHGTPGEGWVPSYQMYDELCEDSQPVEVVKIQKLIVQDGVIRDNYIIEKAMIQ